MIAAFILAFVLTRSMPRRTISISDSIDELVRDLAFEGESFSAAVSRLVELGATSAQGRKVPGYVGVADGPPDDLGHRAEQYLREYYANEWTD
jgi:hypothetical protein